MKQDWNTVYLPEICEIKTGKHDANHAANDGKYRFYTCSSEYSRCNTTNFSGESVIVPGNGDIGLVFYYDGEFDAYQRTYVLQNIKIDAKFLYYHMLLHWRNRNINKQFGSTVQYVRMSNFTNYSVSYPDIDEQKLIVTKIEELFSKLDKGVEELNKIKEQLKIYRQSVLKEAFDNIDNAENCCLDELTVCKPRNGFSPKAVNYETPYKNLTLSATTSGRFLEGYFKYIEIENIEEKQYLWVKNDDILIQRANTIDYVGIAAIYRGKDDVYVYPDLMMKIHLNEGINPMFVLYQLHSPKVRKYYKKSATGTAGNMPKINQGIVSGTPLKIAELDTQNDVVEEIEHKLSVCDKIEQTVNESLQKAESLRQSILKQAFEGKLV